MKVINDKTVRRQGSTATGKIDAQIVAATNRDLQAAVRLVSSAKSSIIACGWR